MLAVKKLDRGSTKVTGNSTVVPVQCRHWCVASAPTQGRCPKTFAVPTVSQHCFSTRRHPLAFSVGQWRVFGSSASFSTWRKPLVANFSRGNGNRSTIGRRTWAVWQYRWFGCFRRCAQRWRFLVGAWPQRCRGKDSIRMQSHTQTLDLFCFSNTQTMTAWNWFPSLFCWHSIGDRHDHTLKHSWLWRFFIWRCALRRFPP